MDTEHGVAGAAGEQAPPVAPAVPGPLGSAAARQHPVPGAPPPPPPPPPPGWPGWPDSGWAAPHGPGRRPRRRRGLALAAAGTALALAAGFGTWAALGNTGPAALSTANIAHVTDAGLADVISTIDYGRGTAEGTGMVLTASGEILTNNHVIAGATSIKVRDVGNGQTYPAKVVGYSDTSDVAVLQLQGASGLSTVSIGDSAKVAVGQRVVALGNAQGRNGTPAVARGTVTGLNASIVAQDAGDGAQEHLHGMIRTDANIQPGDSGGPLVNASGQVIGMDTAASTGNGPRTDTTSSASTTAFAIPINHAMAIAQQIEHGTSSATVHIGPTGFLGVAVNLVQGQSGFGQTVPGATIAGVLRGTPAAAAGLAAGDTITSVGGHAVTSNSDLQNVIELYHPGDKVTVTWTGQAGQSQNATVTLATGPAG